jgi:hypothetical protein
MSWAVIVGRQSADRDEVALFGTFPTLEHAEAFIEAAHNPDADCGDVPCQHLVESDTLDAEPVYMNEILMSEVTA